MDFKEVIGQEEAQRRLLQMMDGQKVPHAIMLCGPTGCGKMAVALAFASALLKSGSNNTAACEAMLRKWAHPDLHFSFPVIRPTGTSSEHKMVSADFIRQWTALLEEGPYFSMEQWLQRMDAQNQQAIIFEAESDAITHKLSLKSSQGGWKVCLIWLPERMNAACANKILKILEEPP
ncbi:MAG: ATP-binding protein, partial [Prevotella sp.]|nr:ATP-binding protein [Prevotella sp.]